MNGPAAGIRTTKLEKTAQSVTMHVFYEDAILLGILFARFHRDDGFSLTMSAAAGVDYLNTNLPHYLDKSPTYLFNDHYASAVAQIYAEFSKTGTDTWHRKNVEWFRVYLVTEVGAAPHNIRQGYSVPSLLDAYDAIVHELKEPTSDRWQRNESIKHVRAFLACIDELIVLEGVFSRKVDFFQRLRKDVDTFELQDKEAGKPPENKDGETPWGRIAFAGKPVPTPHH